jgi:cephalosporin hydroxylase
LAKRRLGPSLHVAAYAFLTALCIATYIYGASSEIVVRRFTQLSFDDPHTWKRNHWLGIRTLQNPNDVWIIQEIIFDVKPDLIIETGTLNGGSAILWAMILSEVNSQGKVITIDTEDKISEARKSRTFQERVEFILGSSTDPRIVSEISTQAKGKKVLVILDSNHKRDHVLKEIEGYGPLVSVGSYLIVQDSIVNGHPVRKEHGPGPMEAIDSFLSSTDKFAPDLERERLLFTMHPRGYLKRIK